MSWILTHKKYVAAMALLLAVIMAFTCLWPLSALIALGVALLALNRLIVRHTDKSRLLGAQREVSLYDALVVGDLISNRQVKAVVGDKGDTLTITAPRRTLEATYRILLHLISILKPGGTCVVTDGGNRSRQPYSPFDIPYFSLVTRKELNVENLIVKQRLPIVYSLLTIVKSGGVIHRNYVEAPCPDNRITELCRSHDIRLVYLTSRPKGNKT